MTVFGWLLCHDIMGSYNLVVQSNAEKPFLISLFSAKENWTRVPNEYGNLKVWDVQIRQNLIVIYTKN